MNFAEQPASEQWAVLRYKGETLAEVWFKPDDDPFALTFRIPRNSFHLPGMAQRLTLENLLKSVGIATTEVASWNHDLDTADSELRQPLPSPPEEVAHLTVYVRMKPSPTVTPRESDTPEIPEERWQTIDSRWKAILGVEASVETLRISLEGLRTQLEDSSRKVLTSDEKTHAMNADIAVWTKAKSRLMYTLPKLKEFLHRSTWAKGNPERKKLDEIIANYIRPRIPFPEIDKVANQLENLLKDRQVLFAQGVAVQQECSSIFTEVQGALRTLQSNAASNANKKRSAAIAKGKL